MQLFAKFKKILRREFRATLNFRKVLETVTSYLKPHYSFKVSLKTKKEQKLFWKL